MIVIFLGLAHIEPRMGTRDQARDYCMKVDTRQAGPWEHGDWNLGGAGRRTDILAVHKRVLDGATEADVCSEFPETYVKYHTGINRMILLNIPKRTVPPTVILLFGPTGTGKTKYAYDLFPNLYRKPCDTRWFDGYLNQQVLLLDDFGGAMSKMGLLYLLQLLDRYPLIVEAKGKYVAMQATTIIITTNYHPRLWYSYDKREESYNALKRRIHKILFFGCFGQGPMVCDDDIFYGEYWEGRPITQFCVALDDSDEVATTMSVSSDQSDDEDDSDPANVNGAFVPPRKSQ